MKYRKTRTGEEISTIGIGASRIHEMSEKEICDLTDYAIEQGINLFDLAMSYPEPLEHIGKALKDRRNQMNLQMHLGMTFPNGQYVRTRNVSEVKEGFEDQMRRLGTDYIDFGMIHYVDDANDFEEIFASGAFEYAEQLKSDGKIRYLGVASHAPEICHKFIENADVDTIMFSVNAAYDLDPVNNLPFEGFETDGRDQLSIANDRLRLYRECEKRGIGIQVMKPYGGGLLLDAKVSPFEQAMSIPQCIQYALDRPSVLTCLLGVRSESEMEEAVRYYSTFETERDYSFISRLRHQDMRGVCIYCNHCLPCPSEIDIAAVHKYLDLYLADDELAKEHYLALGKNASDCIECGSCEKNCPFGVQVIQKMRQAKSEMR